MSDSEMEAKLRQVFEEHVPFNKVIGLRVESTDPDAPKLRFDMRPELIGNPRRQILHGGVISAVLDVAAGFAIHLAVSKSRDAKSTRATGNCLPSAPSTCMSTICGRDAANTSSPRAAWCGSAIVSRSRTWSW